MHQPQEVKAKILQALRHGPLDVQELAGEIDVPPFTTEAYLKDMHRDGLCDRWSWTAGPNSWVLTPKGDQAALAAAQLRLA